MDTSADWSQLIFRLDRSVVERRLEAILGHALEQPLVFQRRFGLDKGAGRILAFQARTMLADLSGPDSLLARGHATQETERLLIAALLHSEQHNYSRELREPGRRSLPRHLRRARNFIVEHLDQDITVEILAMETGVSGRTLYRGFHDFLGTTPSTYLRELRLDAAHQSLLEAGPESKITDIALRYRFNHLGRFAADYRTRFGEYPTETLRR